jgi:hypothetical protein
MYVTCILFIFLFRYVPLLDFLPGAEDNMQLSEHLVVLVGNIWANEIPGLAWLKEHLPSSISHPYQKEMKKKTQKVR